jgi:hypothetical protein
MRISGIHARLKYVGHALPGVALAWNESGMSWALGMEYAVANGQPELTTEPRLNEIRKHVIVLLSNKVVSVHSIVSQLCTMAHTSHSYNSSFVAKAATPNTVSGGRWPSPSLSMNSTPKMKLKTSKVS